MAQKALKAQLVHMHGTEREWAAKWNMVPAAGEILIYDADDENEEPRIKAGDGKTCVADLPFLKSGADVETISGSSADYYTVPMIDLGSHDAEDTFYILDDKRIIFRDGVLYSQGFSGNGSDITNINADNIISGTINAARLPDATESSKGAMSSEDKIKLNTFDQSLVNGAQAGQFLVFNGTAWVAMTMAQWQETYGDSNSN